MRQRYSKHVVTATIFASCIVLTGLATAQTRTGEGVSRQVVALKTMLESVQARLEARIAANEASITALDGRLTTAETNISNNDADISALTARVGSVEGTINDHTRCFNSGVTSIYWPRHPSADGRGCVRHTDIVTAPPPPPPPPAANCAGGSRTWSQNGQSCTGSYGPIPHGTSITVRDHAPVGNICQNRYQNSGSIHLSCNNGSIIASGANCVRRNYYDEPTCRGSCFTADTKVLMADLTRKDIHKVKVGDKLMGRDGAVHTVLDLDRPLLWKGKPQHLIEINGEKAFTTDNHPILTTTGWKAVNPEMAEKEAYDQLSGHITPLEVGDEIVMSEGKTLEVKSIKVLPQEDKKIRLYNLLLDGDHTYYANDMLVHGSVPDKNGKYPLAKEHNGE